MALGLLILAGAAFAAPSAGARVAQEPRASVAGPGILYDDLPFSLEADVRADFVLGPKWTRTNLTYKLVSGTNDIAGTGENVAVRQAFDLWEQVSALRFTEVASNAAADIEIRWAPYDGQYKVLAYAYFPQNGDVYFDEDEQWTTSGGGIDLVTVAAHELGHSIGLHHSNTNGALMYPYYNGPHRFLHADDIAGVQAHYGSGGGPAPTTTTTMPVTTTTTSSSLPKFSVSDVTVTEPVKGAVRAEFTVSLSAPSIGNTWVDVTTVDGTATNRLDYRAVDKTLKLKPGEMSKVVRIQVKSDKLDEAAEKYTVTLHSPLSATIADASGIGTINDVS